MGYVKNVVALSNTYLKGPRPTKAVVVLFFCEGDIRTIENVSNNSAKIINSWQKVVVGRWTVAVFKLKLTLF